VADSTINRPLTWVALGLIGALVIALAVAGLVLTPSANPAAAPSAPPATGPVPLVPVDSPQAGSAPCTALVKALPTTLPNGPTPLRRRPLADPAPPATAAWGAGDSPVVLRCGVEQPPEFTATSEVLEINGVQWLKVDGDDAATWYAVDRPACVALTLAGGLGTGPIQQVSTVISATMTPVTPHPAGG
jgi:hypothetical protein